MRSSFTLLLPLVTLATVIACRAPADENDSETTSNDLRASLYNTGTMGSNVRAQPNTQSAIIASVRPNSSVDITCQTSGETISGTPVWDYLAQYDGYVSDAFLWTGFDGFSPQIPRCAGSGSGGGGGTAPSINGYRLPLECGTSATVTQAHGGLSHTGTAYWGTDFGVALNTPLVAIDDGIVKFANGSVQPGDDCYSGGGPGCINTVNYVSLAHADGTDSTYVHVNKVLVTIGQHVRRGERVALSGATGWATGPHTHVQRQERCGAWWCNAVKVLYEDVPDGDPYAGQWVTSQNCLASASP